MSNPNPVKPPTIESVGLKKYLMDTSEKHDGWGYFTFTKCINKGMSKSEIARTFKVSRNTIIKWVSIYEREQNASK